ncbi:prenyltransferase [bacterium]|nr:prenyltransferase [bacterium]
MFKKTTSIMECSRIFSLPTTIFSWLVIFTYGVIDSGNILYGLITFIGLCFAHLGTNLIDDYFDYKYLIKQVNFDKKEYLKHSQKTKCRYLISGQMKESQIIKIIIFHFSIALLSGLFLFLKCGVGVLYFALIGAGIALLYPFVSRFCLSEIAVAIAYGPALFGGVYYVMTGTYSNDVYILSIPTMLMTVVLLYIHTVMDYDFDTAEGKFTIANRFNSQLDSLIILKILLFAAYLSLILLCIFDILDWQVFIVCLTIPLSIDLYNSLKEFSCNSENMPEKKWYHFPMEKLNYFIERNEGSFMFRMLQARNLMMFFAIFLTLAIIISLGL